MRGRLPPIPQRFASMLKQTANWCFSSRQAINPIEMYSFDQYLHEAMTGRAIDYLAFSHGGHGVNSYALTCQTDRLRNVSLRNRRTSRFVSTSRWECLKETVERLIDRVLAARLGHETVSNPGR